MIKNYSIENILNRGNYNNIYLCTHDLSRNKYIIKEEKSNIKLLRHEYEIYKTLDINNVTCNIIEYFKYKNNNYLVLNNNGIDLYKFKKLYNKSDNYHNYVVAIIIKIISNLSFVHSCKILHRDIKPSNICIKNNIISIIDYGFSIKYTYRGKHRENLLQDRIIGTPNFVSENILLKNTPSLRDDIESVIYIFMFLVFTKKQYNIYKNLDLYEKKKSNFIISVLKNYIKKDELYFDKFNILNSVIIYIKNIDYYEIPEYNYLKNKIYYIFKI